MSTQVDSITMAGVIELGSSRELLAELLERMTMGEKLAELIIRRIVNDAASLEIADLPPSLVKKLQDQVWERALA